MNCNWKIKLKKIDRKTKPFWNLPMNPKMYFIVGTRMTKTLLSARSMTAIRKCLIQLKGLLGNNSVVTEVRICNKKVQRQGHSFVFNFVIWNILIALEHFLFFRLNVLGDIGSQSHTGFKCTTQQNIICTPHRASIAPSKVSFHPHFPPSLPTSTSAPPPFPLAITTLLSVSLWYVDMFFG